MGYDLVSKWNCGCNYSRDASVTKFCNSFANRVEIEKSSEAQCGLFNSRVLEAIASAADVIRTLIPLPGYCGLRRILVSKCKRRDVATCNPGGCPQHPQFPLLTSSLFLPLFHFKAKLIRA